MLCSKLSCKMNVLDGQDISFDSQQYHINTIMSSANSKRHVIKSV